MTRHGENSQSVDATDYAAVFKNAKPPGDTLAQFDALYPFLADFRATSATRPYFRLLEDYAISPPLLRPLGPLTAQIKLSKILTLHAVLALDHHQPDLALEDIKINYKLLSGVKRSPTLIAGLVAIGMNAIGGAAIYDGLAQHAWNNAQLIELEHTLQPVDFLVGYQLAMRGEVTYSVANFDFYKKLADRQPDSFYKESGSNWSAMLGLAWHWPSGWWDDNKSQLITFYFYELATVDPSARRVFLPEGAAP